MTRAGRLALALSTLLIVAAAGSAALAQEATPPDSAAPAVGDSAAAAVADSGAAAVTAPDSTIDLTPPRTEATTTPKPAEEEAGSERLDRDRFEFGVAVVEGYFDWLGTFGYRRFLREGGPFQQNLVLELEAGKKGYLSEGAFSFLYLFRPLHTFHPEWRIRPLLEAGPGAHLVIQVADIEGFSDTGFHTKVYGKLHAYAGFEALVGRRWGILVRGRLVAPADRPLDYAQAAIFLR